jgi:PTS system mannose-specific IIB component/fructoselysine and glucoselysine-specific PTS system IIB component
MIKLTRIDDRLVHGQVSFTWVPSLDINCLLIANDKIAVDEFQKMAFNLAKPPAAKLLIYTVSQAVTFLNDPKSANAKILILVNNVADAYRLTQEVKEVVSVNFGGIRMKPGARLISKAVALDEKDIELVKLMSEKGIELEIRQVPGDKKQPVEQLI